MEGFTGYTVRMIEEPQLGDGGKLINMFCVEGGEPHPNPTVSKYADFAYFEFSPRGFMSASMWLAHRGQGEFAQLLIDIAPEREPDGLLQIPAIPSSFPTVCYEEVRNLVPKDHLLVGLSSIGIETVKSASGALVWIVGMSGTGRTNTLVLRVEERAAMGHKFLGYDPHWFKDGSLTNTIYENTETHAPKGYHDLFLMPMAHSPQEGKAVLQAFLDEFDGRKSGQIQKPWQHITILLNEIDCLMEAASEGEEEVAQMLRRVVRICSQEGRQFHLGGICTSQRVSGLAWLRKLASLMIIHQLLMQSERELACHGNKAVMADMDQWPVGRTYVFGLGISSPQIVQQPYFSGHGADTLGDE